MGIEFDCEIPIRKTVMIPIAGMVEHYKKEGFIIKSIKIEENVIGEYRTGNADHKREMLLAHPNATIKKRDDGTYYWTDSHGNPNGLLVTLEAIKELQKGRLK